MTTLEVLTELAESTGWQVIPQGQSAWIYLTKTGMALEAFVYKGEVFICPRSDGLLAKRMTDIDSISYFSVGWDIIRVHLSDPQSIPNIQKYLKG